MSPDDHIGYQPETLTQALSGRDVTDLLPFAGLSDAELQTILSQANVCHIPAGDTCFHEGDAAKYFYVLLDGVLRVARTTQEGEQVVLLHIGQGQMFGIAKAFDNSCYRATAKAASRGLALAWPSELWDEFAAAYPSFQSATRKAIGGRMDEMQDKIVGMATQQVEQRIANALLKLGAQVGETCEDGIEIGFPITRQDISEMTGTTLHSVSRYLSKWQKSGIIESARRRITIRRPEDLPT